MSMWSQRGQALTDPNVKKWRFRSFLVVLTAVSLVSPVALWAIGRLSIRTYVVVMFICVLVCGEIFAPPTADNGWWRRLRWLKVVGWVLLLSIVVERVLVVLQ